MSLGSTPPRPLPRLSVPGDKSISHRALLLAALSPGTSQIRGLLPGADCQSTASALRSLGVAIPPLPTDGGLLTLSGVGPGGLTDPAESLDCGNSGTTARLLLGILAGAGVTAVLTGDASLRGRPMRRVTEPLRAMGAVFEELGEADRLPIRVRPAPGGFQGGRVALDVASAQVKSALLLAGLVSGRAVEVSEPGPSRDHTERMLLALGVPLEILPHPDPALPGGRLVRLPEGPHPLRPLELTVPGDPSSAAFLMALAALGGAGEGVELEGVGLNPTRIGAFRVLERMGARIQIEATPGVEPWGTVRVFPGELQAVEIGGEEIPTLIDEIPILAALAARARGRTRIRDAHELRVKESDRIEALASNLRGLGVEVVTLPDGLDVVGSDAPLVGEAQALHDHRIAMAFGVLGALPGCRIEVDDPEVVEVSYPGFWSTLASLSRRPPVVTLDGPAGSGKSSTARAVAARLGYLHLDSGALYRAVTLALLESGRPEAEWARVTVAELDAFGIALESGPQGLRVRVGEGYPEAGLRSTAVTDRVSAVARIPAVRDWLLGAQRATGRKGGVVADGRDMGTVVFPGAEVKIFLEADLEERARRRLLETGGASEGEALHREAEKLSARDESDRSRTVAPLRPAADAVFLDTTHLDFEAQVDRVVALVRERGGG
jgi:3-phosphoshikimate 1-carboxyvinyltransferase